MKTHEVWFRMGDGKEKVVVGDFEVFVDMYGKPAYLKGIEYDAGTMTRVTPLECLTVIPMDNVLRFHTYEGAKVRVGRMPVSESHRGLANDWPRKLAAILSAWTHGPIRAKAMLHSMIRIAQDASDLAAPEETLRAIYGALNDMIEEQYKGSESRRSGPWL